MASRAGLSDGAGHSDHVWLLDVFSLRRAELVFFFDPETNDCSLDSIEAMFMPSHPLYFKMELAYRKSRGCIGYERGFVLGTARRMRGASLSTSMCEIESARVRYTSLMLRRRDRGNISRYTGFGGSKAYRLGHTVVVVIEVSHLSQCCLTLSEFCLDRDLVIISSQ